MTCQSAFSAFWVVLDLSAVTVISRFYGLMQAKEHARLQAEAMVCPQAKMCQTQIQMLIPIYLSYQLSYL